jgi:phosphoribosylaminoimidazole-succinocarboxamide synthase
MPIIATPLLFESSITSLPLLGRGKVRDIYALGDDKLLIVTTDRLSAFDVILPDPDSRQGCGADRRRELLVRQTGARDSQPADRHRSGIRGFRRCRTRQVRGRALVVKRLKPLPIEAVARGYLIGSGWKDYQSSGGVCGIPLPAGLQMAQQLPEAIFTPATKAEAGDHDENISFADVES